MGLSVQSAAGGGGGTAATQTDQETGTSTTTFVSPGTQQFHPSAAKFWALATAAGSLTTSYNLTSVTDTGAGDITFTIATDFSSANWAHAVSANGVFSTTAASAKYPETGTKAAGTIQLRCRDGTLSLADPSTSWNIAGYGDQ